MSINIAPTTSARLAKLEQELVDIERELAIAESRDEPTATIVERWRTALNRYVRVIEDIEEDWNVAETRYGCATDRMTEAQG